MARFTDLMVPERVQPFWAALQRGKFINDAAVEVGTCRKKGARWVAACGGTSWPWARSAGRYLSFAEREEIALARARGESMRGIARRLLARPSIPTAPAAGTVAERNDGPPRGPGYPSQPRGRST
jgi:transposase, IS30 family